MSAELEQVPGFLFFDHVAISVKPGELEAHVQAYQAMGFKEVHREDVLGGDQVREVLLQVGDGPNLVQLLEPLTPESPVAKQIEKNGGRGGMAHVALRVADIQKAFDYLKERGFKIIDKAPRKGSRGTTVFFVHPKTTEAAAFGYLLEVVQEGAMPEADAGAEILNLARDFPPVSTEAWEAAIAKDLKGARLRKEAGVAHRRRARRYGPTTARKRSPGSTISCARAPGRYPFVRGTGRGWEIAQNAKPGPKAVRADLLHEAGAHAVQELGYAIAAGVERLAS